ncbi:MAG: hypothetical protein KIT74_03420 [Fimbriimonadales bacterium]|nr:hypothetical protein [Fimbriimonadales bacterium]
MKQCVAFLFVFLIFGCSRLPEPVSAKSVEESSALQLAVARDKIDKLAKNTGEFVQIKSELQDEIDKLRFESPEVVAKLQAKMDKLHLASSRVIDAATEACWSTGIDATIYGLGGYTKPQRSDGSKPPQDSELPTTKD